MRLRGLGVLAVFAALIVFGSSCQAVFSRPPLGRPLQEGQPYDEGPVPVTQVLPNYPEFARAAQIKGTVVIHVLVGESGRVERVKVIHGVTGLTDAAVDSARHWVFKPALRNHLPVEAWYEIPFVFP